MMTMKKVMIFGSSGLGKLVQYSLDEERYEITAFIDNCKDIQGKTFNDIRIISPGEIIHYDYDYIIISLPEYEKEMRGQLSEIGVADEKVITFMPYMNGVSWQEPRYAMLKNCAEQILTRKIQGDVAEVGVYQGEFSARLNTVFSNRKLYLFDTFQGFSDKDQHINDKIITGKEGFKDTNVDIVMKKMKCPEQVIIKKGWFPETAKDLEAEFCFVSLDTDLYMPILNGLKYFYPRLVKGGYIFIHDFGSYNWTGVREAVLEYCMNNQISFVPILDKCLSVIITK